MDKTDEYIIYRVSSQLQYIFKSENIHTKFAPLFLFLPCVNSFPVDLDTSRVYSLLLCYIFMRITKNDSPL